MHAPSTLSPAYHPKAEEVVEISCDYPVVRCLRSRGYDSAEDGIRWFGSLYLSRARRCTASIRPVVKVHRNESATRYSAVTAETEVSCPWHRLDPGKKTTKPWQREGREFGKSGHSTRRLVV